MLELTYLFGGDIMAIFKNSKQLTYALLSSILILAACQSEESTEVKINPSLARTPKEPTITYGVKDNSIYEKPKIVQYNPYTGDKKTIFEAPPAPSKAIIATVESNADNLLPVPTLPKAEIKQRLSSRLADLLGEQRSVMFDARMDKLNTKERQALVCLRQLINAPLAKNNELLQCYTQPNEINVTYIAERCFYEASKQLKERQVKADVLNKLAQKYWHISPDWQNSNSSFISYDAKKQLFTLKNGNAWEQSSYLGSDIIDLSIKESAGNYYVNAHEINYLSLNNLLNDNEQKSILRQTGLITCGDWLIGYYDNRFESSHIKNGGIIFADYYWLDSYDYELKLQTDTNDFYLASKNLAFGSKSNDNYKPRICQPASSKRLNFQKAKLNLKLGEHYLAAALPKKALFNEQVVANYTNSDDLIYLDLPFNDYVLVFSLSRKDAKKPAFVSLNKLSAKR